MIENIEKVNNRFYLRVYASRSPRNLLDTRASRRLRARSSPRRASREFRKLVESRASRRFRIATALDANWAGAEKAKAKRVAKEKIFIFEFVF